jgi:Plasmid pRiA4b ORF-3-like protein
VSSQRANMGRKIHKTSRGRAGPMPMRTWLSIRVELVEGRGEHYWPRPGRLFAAAKSHSYAQLATAIDDAFARWDRSHLHEFELIDGTRIGISNPELDNEGVLDETRETLSRLQTSQQFIYVFDFGDDWTHLCTVVDASLDPLEALGQVPNAPLLFFGWGSIPDQYGRAWAEEDAESSIPIDPELTDLPPLRPGWGPNS